jgi:hypothetical protein
VKVEVLSLHNDLWISISDSWDKNGLTALTTKQAELSLGTIVSLCFFQKNVLSYVSPRNFVLQVFAISLFLYSACKSIRELVLVTNCIYCVLSAFSEPFIYMLETFVSTVNIICWGETSNKYASISRV